MVAWIFTLYSTIGRLSVAAVGTETFDPVLSHIDCTLLGFDPSREIQRFLTPGRVEAFAVAYAWFIPYIHLALFFNLESRGGENRERFLTAWTLLYAVSYLGYLFVPAFGPARFRSSTTTPTRRRLLLATGARLGGRLGRTVWCVSKPARRLQRVLVLFRLESRPAAQLDVRADRARHLRGDDRVAVSLRDRPDRGDDAGFQHTHDWRLDLPALERRGDDVPLHQLVGAAGAGGLLSPRQRGGHRARAARRRRGVRQQSLECVCQRAAVARGAAAASVADGQTDAETQSGLAAAVVGDAHADGATARRTQGTADNRDTIARLAAFVAAGEQVAIFPEGFSHSEGRLRPFKTGAARIVTQAVEQSRRVAVVPVGLVYLQKSAFRSDVIVSFGPAIEIAKLPADEREAHALTAHSGAK